MSPKNKPKTTPKLTYQKAVEELEEILEKIQEDKVDLDELISQLKKAYELIDFCKSRIKQTEMKIEEINDKFNN